MGKTNPKWCLELISEKIIPGLKSMSHFWGLNSNNSATYLGNIAGTYIHLATHSSLVQFKYRSKYVSK
jgi:hypothetical protein